MYEEWLQTENADQVPTMTDDRRTRGELIVELERLHTRAAELEEAAELARQESDTFKRLAQQFRELTESTSDWIWEVDENAVYTYASPKVEELLGYEPDEILGKRPFDLMPPEEAERVAAIFGSVVQAREPFHRMENTNIRKDGQLVVLDTSGVPVFDGSGEFRGYRGIDRDITAQKRAEEELDKYRQRLEEQVTERTADLNMVVDQLKEEICDRIEAEASVRESEARLQALLNAMPDLMFRMSNDGEFLDYQAPSAERLAFPPEEFLGKRVHDLFPEEFAAFTMIHLERALETNVTQVYEYELPVLTGEVRSFEARMIAAGPEEVVVIVRDVTEQRKLEAEIQKIETLESVGILAGGIAHDFNNILAAILGNISLAKMLLPPGAKAYIKLEEAEKASYRARELTAQLLTFSMGGTPVRKTASISILLRESAGFALRGSNVTIDFSIAEDLSQVDVDQGQIGQVISNLVINADQAMPEGGTIELSAENVIVEADQRLTLPNGRYVRISLRDEGTGIPEEHLPRIFEPYFTTKQTGSGLGLAVCYSVVQGHEGRITAESRLGEGTTFHIYLPASLEEVEEGEQPALPAVPGHGKILVMDDEDAIQVMADGMLQEMGYEVRVAANGEQAIEMYGDALQAGEPFEVVIMDLTIPGGMGGKEAVKELRQLDPALKAIVSSGYSNDPIMSNFREYGFDAALAKPYGASELSAAIQKARHTEE